MKTIRNGEGSVTLQNLLHTKSNHVTWSIKMCVDLQVQSLWDIVENGDVKERNDKMTLATIYQVVLEDVLLMLAEKDSTKAAWEALQTMHVGVKRVKEAKVQTLKSEFEATCMKDSESIDGFSMKLTTIISGIRITQRGGVDLRRQKVPSSSSPKIHAYFCLH